MSQRSSRRRKVQPAVKAKLFCGLKKDPECLKKVYINKEIGFGVFTEEELKKGDFICEYSAEIIKAKVGYEREKSYEEQGKGSFMYFYSNYCYDATEIECISKYINDSPSDNANAKMSTVLVDSTPRLVLFATKSIKSGTEIRYDYGEDAEKLWWRKKDCCHDPWTVTQIEDQSKNTEEPAIGNCIPIALHDNSPAFLSSISKQKNEEKPATSCAIKKSQITSGKERPKEAINLEDGIDFKIGSGDCWITSVTTKVNIDAKELLEELIEKVVSMEPPFLVYQSDSPSETDIILPGLENDNILLNVQEPPQSSSSSDNSFGSSQYASTLPCFPSDDSPMEDILQFKKQRKKITPKLFDEDNEDSGDDDWENVIPFSKKPLEAIKKLKNKNVLCPKDLIIESSEDVEDFVALPGLENYLDRSSPDSFNSSVGISNDSGLDGDFPSFINTDEDDAIDARVEEDIKNQSSHSDYQSRLPRSLKRKRKYYSSEQDEEDPESDHKDSDFFPVSSSSDESDDDDDGGGGDVDKDERVMSNVDHLQTKGKKVDDYEYKENDDKMDCAEPVVTIPRTNKTSDGGRVYDKIHYCLYCGKGFLKIARHLQSIHKEEEFLKSLSSEPKQKKKTLDWLRYKGDYVQNIKILKTGGELVVWRRPNPHDVVSVSDFVPCEFCLVFVTKTELWRHHKSCQFVKDGVSGSIKASKTLLYANIYNIGASKELKVLLLDKMNKDAISAIVFKDELITTYGSFQLENGGLRKAHTISERMRLLGRLVIELRDKSGNASFSLSEFIRPEYFDSFIECTKKLGGYSIQTKNEEPVASFTTPSLPLKLGYTIEKCASLLRGKSIKIRDATIENEACRFLEIFKMEWSTRISSISLKTLGTNKFEKVQLLPVTEDLLKVKDYLTKGIQILSKELSNNPDACSWRRLAEMVGTRLTIFNRRRANEVYNILVDRFNERHKWKEAEMDEIVKSLTPLERTLMSRLNVVHVRGKRGRQVPVLFNTDEEKAINLLIRYRTDIGISEKNIYIFAAPTRKSLKPLRGNDCLRKIVGEIPELQFPERIKSTQLRKYCATVTQIMSLDENGLRWLADHMGHNLDVHREFYRLKDSTIELSKVSRLLMTIDEGNVQNFAGKKLSEISIDELPPLPEENGKRENDDEDIDSNDLEESEESNATPIETISSDNVPNAKRPWTPAESNLVLISCHKHIVGNSLPGKNECDMLLKNQILKGRKWTNIKDFVRNHKKKMR